LGVVGVFTTLFPAAARKARLPGQAEEEAVDGEGRVTGGAVRTESLGAQELAAGGLDGLGVGAFGQDGPVGDLVLAVPELSLRRRNPGSREFCVVNL
jgi:hypothetical protein